MLQDMFSIITDMLHISNMKFTDEDSFDKEKFIGTNLSLAGKAVFVWDRHGSVWECAQSMRDVITL